MADPNIQHTAVIFRKMETIMLFSTHSLDDSHTHGTSAMLKYFKKLCQSVLILQFLRLTVTNDLKYCLKVLPFSHSEH